MDSSLISGLLNQLQGAPVNQIAQKLGTDPATIENALNTALPLIMATLGHRAQQSGGAANPLMQALQQGGQSGGMPDLSQLLGGLASGQGQSGGLGGMLGNVLGSLTGGQQGKGGVLGGLLGSVLGGGGGQAEPQQNSGVLGQIFGGAQAHAQDGLGQATGLGSEKAGHLLAVLAPLVMAHVANHAQANNLDAAGLSAALGQEHSAVQNQGSAASSLLGAVLSRI